MAEETPPLERLTVAAADLSELEERFAVDAIRSTQISGSGPYVDQFEREFAELCGSGTALAVANGTVALHLALLALDVRPGDEVLIPSLTYVATANAVRYCGAEPVFVDVDPETWCIDPARVEDRITPRTRGIIPVHLYGHPADMDAINHIAGVHGLWVIEDAAEAHFAKYRGRPVGGISHIATFSFYGNKIFTCGEGGAVTTSDPYLTTRMKTLRGQGMDPNRRYYFPVTGYNFRLTNLACAILCAQLERRDEILTLRRGLFEQYRNALDGIGGVGFQPIAPWAQVAPWLFSITIDANVYGMSRDEVARILDSSGIETRPFFIPLHQLPPFREGARSRGGDFTHSTRLGESGLNLPTHRHVRPADVERIANLLWTHAQR
jgi:perosamine synthetase